MNETMKDRLKMLATAYTFPVIMAVVILLKGITVDGNPVGQLGLMAIGFILGMMLEGLCMIVFGTIAILSGKLD